MPTPLADLRSGRWETVAQVPGFTRGIDFYGPLAFIGLSQVRESAVFSGIPLVQRLKERTCGVWVVHIETGQTVGFLRFEAGVQEIFAVQVLPGIRFPEMLEWGDPRLANTYVLPDAALAEVARPTAEELARSPDAHFQRGAACYRAGQFAEAIAAYRECVALQPEYPHARYHLGVALGDADQYDEAVDVLRQVSAAEPERAEAYNSLGYCYSRLGNFESAVSCYEHAIGLQPQYPHAHLNLGLTLLQLGNYARGFAEYEWRWQSGEYPPFQCPHPKWDGTPVPDKTLLIHTEQGAGDAIQFARYLPMAAERCKKLILVCPPNLIPVMATLPGIGQIREAGAITVAEFDTYLPLLSLPRVFGTTPANIPGTVPYIDIAMLRRRKDLTALANLSLSAQPRVGVVWAGSPTYRNDRQRSCTPQDFIPVFETARIEFYSLQKDDRSKELTQLPPNLRVEDLASLLHDFGDTALLVDQLDLVISVDTALAHLAGAMGKPVWVLLSHLPDWRWASERETSPWYPTMRLFRQTQAGDWSSVMQRVSERLAEWREQLR